MILRCIIGSKLLRNRDVSQGHDFEGVLSEENGLSTRENQDSPAYFNNLPCTVLASTAAVRTWSSDFDSATTRSSGISAVGAAAFTPVASKTRVLVMRPGVSGYAADMCRDLSREVSHKRREKSHGTPRHDTP